MNGDCRKQSQTSTAGHVQEKEDGDPYYSAFCTEQDPASLASKKKISDKNPEAHRTCNYSN